ncbi:unnamed protein product [Cylicocyclus nassatus]|uniref:Uncharacterized protein n=1 Tax=Cylicocyclus nassatus TaxID=53992 RepID=A0AA36DW16_CYLNA|nr:unnamed protein product [Cylicocyclus nassatus]
MNLVRDEEKEVYPAAPMTGENSCGKGAMCGKSAPLELSKEKEDLESRKSRSTYISGNSSPEEDDYEEEEE